MSVVVAVVASTRFPVAAVTICVVRITTCGAVVVVVVAVVVVMAVSGVDTLSDMVVDTDKLLVHAVL